MDIYWPRNIFITVYFSFAKCSSNTHTHIYIYIHIYVSSSSCHALSKDIPDPLSLPLPIDHCFWEVLRATSRIDIELLYVGSSWFLCLYSFMCGNHRSTSLMSSSLLLQQCLTYLVHIIFIVFVMGGRWPCTCYFVGCCLHMIKTKTETMREEKITNMINMR